MCLNTISIPSPNKAFFYEVPCGKCPECRKKNALHTAQRCQHEMSLYPDNNCMITLTYDDDLKDHYNYDYRDFQNFLKRLRHKYSPTKIRYIASMEYGGKNGRLHFHALLFNFFPRNYNSQNQEIPLKPIKKTPKGNLIYYSSELDELWKNGFISCGPASIGGAYYIASYALSENFYIDPLGEIHSDKYRCSKNPGIGFNYFVKHYKSLIEIAIRDKVTLPRFYCKKLEELFPEDFIYYKSELARVTSKSSGDEYARLCEILSLRQQTDFRSEKDLTKLKLVLSDFYRYRYLKERFD